MAKLLYKPFGLLFGFIAGFTGKKLFKQIWGVFDTEEPPDTKVRNAPLFKAALATGLEAAILKATKVTFDRWARNAFLRVTGSWPGDEEPERE